MFLNTAIHILPIKPLTGCKEETAGDGFRFVSCGQRLLSPLPLLLLLVILLLSVHVGAARVFVFLPGFVLLHLSVGAASAGTSSFAASCGGSSRTCCITSWGKTRQHVVWLAKPVVWRLRRAGIALRVRGA